MVGFPKSSHNLLEYPQNGAFYCRDWVTMHQGCIGGPLGTHGVLLNHAR